MKGSDFIQILLRSYGINKIYGVLGREAASISFNADYSQDFILVRNELTAGLAAIGASRLTGQPQACFSTLGPGVTHMATAIGTACQDRDPVLFFTAQLETQATDYNNAHQCIDAVSVSRPITKYSSEPTTLEQLAVAVDRAFSKMLTYPLGPALISLPIDLLDMPVSDANIAKWLSPESKPVKPTASAAYTTAIDYNIQKACDLLATSKNPIIIVGDTVTKSPDAMSIKHSLEKINMPVITTYSAKGLLPRDHSLYLGVINSYLDVILEEFIQKDIFETVDTVFLLGYDMTEHYPNAWNHGERKKIISLNYFDNETSKSFIPDIKITGDIQAVLQKISEKIESRAVIHEDMVRVHDKILNALDKFMDEEPHKDSLSIPQIIKTLNTLFGPYDYIVANDIGTHRHVTATFFAPQAPHHYLTSAGFSSYGTGIGIAIGAAFARPDKR
ncbi:MAG: thiamine pyrophosphate-binding protein, partial [Deltaproteobacteria bacterium]|nr:thiamine pyrophosphate-binding protein [Deltaproteobacteria bacterium]